MKHYKYKLTNFLFEADGVEDPQKPKDEVVQDKEAQNNVAKVANAIATAVKAKADIDTKKLKATGTLSVKAGSNVKLSGKADFNLKTGKTDISVPIVVNGKKTEFKIKDFDLSNPKNFHNKKINASYSDPVTGKTANLSLKIDPKKDTYEFGLGEESEKFSFGLNMAFDKGTVGSVSGEVGFDTKSLIPADLAPKVKVGGQYDKLGGLSGTVEASKDFKTRTGTLDVSAKGRASAGERYAGVGVTYTPDKKKPAPKTKAGKLAVSGLKKATEFVDTDKGYGQKMVKSDGEEITKAQKLAKDVRSQTSSAKNENKLTMTRKELNILLENMLKFPEV